MERKRINCLKMVLAEKGMTISNWQKYYGQENLSIQKM